MRQKPPQLRSQRQLGEKIPAGLQKHRAQVNLNCENFYFFPDVKGEVYFPPKIMCTHFTEASNFEWRMRRIYFNTENVLFFLSCKCKLFLKKICTTVPMFRVFTIFF